MHISSNRPQRQNKMANKHKIIDIYDSGMYIKSVNGLETCKEAIKLYCQSLQITQKNVKAKYRKI